MNARSEAFVKNQEIKLY